MSYNNIIAFIGMPGIPEMIVIGGVALLIFGRNLPSVGRSLGKGIVEFKKGIKGVKDELNDIDDEIEQEIERSKKNETVQDIPHEYTKEA